MSRFLTAVLILAFSTTLAFGQAGTVRINEIMYDDANSPERDWVELYNTTGAAIDVSGWVLMDCPTFPWTSAEGMLTMPSGTTIPANGYIVVSRVDITADLPFAIMCAHSGGTLPSNGFVMANGGDNLALYTSNDVGATLIDGISSAVTTDYFPDLGNPNSSGTSVEKCDQDAAWPGNSASAWHASSNAYVSASYHFCTPGFANTGCCDAVAPSVVSATALSATQVDVLFSEIVDLVSSETEINYDVPTVGNPLSAVRDGLNLAKVHLTFNPLANNVYTLNVSDVKDICGTNPGGGSAQFTVNVTANPGDVVITEVMYDDTNSNLNPDLEWVEIHNTTANTVDISGWCLSDASTYNPIVGTSSDGALEVPDGYEILAGGYAILCEVDLPDITGEIICTEVVGNWILGNTGDNLVLYTATNNGVLVDGSQTVNYPDLAVSNRGNSIEKCDPNSMWSGNAADWDESTTFYTFNRYYHCTPGFAGVCCNDPEAATVGVFVSGPPNWGYGLTVTSGCVDTVIFTNFCAGTTGSTNIQGWYVLPNGDGNDGDSIIFWGIQPYYVGGPYGLFELYHPTCHDYVNWAAGGNSGQVDGPLPVELNNFDAIAGDAEVRVAWTTQSESNLEHYEVIRNGAMVANIAATNSATGSNYSFVDENLTNGTTYTYELFVIEFDGSRSLIATQSATPTANNAVVTEFALHQNYPNPFNPETQIRFDLAEASDVTLTIFNISGQEVATLVNSHLSSGAHTVSFDAANLTSGVYLYRLTAGSFTAQKKMVLLK
ncbi:lamin tail domain-containing protein [bacterium]|nr:lamin tail domain-containing protein [bacterium]